MWQGGQAATKVSHIWTATGADVSRAWVRPVASPYFLSRGIRTPSGLWSAWVGFTPSSGPDLSTHE